MEIIDYIKLEKFFSSYAGYSVCARESRNISGDEVAFYNAFPEGSTFSSATSLGDKILLGVGDNFYICSVSDLKCFDSSNMGDYLVKITMKCGKSVKFLFFYKSDPLVFARTKKLVANSPFTPVSDEIIKEHAQKASKNFSVAGYLRKDYIYKGLGPLSITESCHFIGLRPDTRISDLSEKDFIDICRAVEAIVKYLAAQSICMPEIYGGTYFVDFTLEMKYPVIKIKVAGMVCYTIDEEKGLAIE